MSWATKRRFIIIAIITAVLVVIGGIIAFFSFHDAPTCTDGKMNQDETGIDCGGVCSRICAPDATLPSASFVRAVPGPTGRTDVVAYLENANANAAARAVKFRIELYASDRTVIAERTGVADLPPSSVTPIYLPNFYSGSEPVAQAFLSFDEGSIDWFEYSDTRIVPEIESAVQGGSETAPRVLARVSNPSAATIPATKLIAVVFDTQGNAMAASQTILPELPGGGSATATFTWTEAFSGAVSRIDVRPVVPLPADARP